MKYKLEELCEFITDGTHQTPEYCEDGGVKFLSSKDVTARKIDWDNVKYIPESLHEKLYARLSPRKDDILLAKNGTTGVAALVDRDEIFDVYVSLAVLRPKDIVYPKYLLYAINSPVAKRQFDAGLKGVGVPNLHLSVIRKTEINIEEYDKQLEVCGILDKVASIIDARKEELQQLDDLIKARFVEMFGDPIKNTKKLPTERMEERFFLKAGITTSADDIHEYTEDEYMIPCYGGNGVRGYVQEKSYEGDYPIIGRQGALCGNVQYVSGKFHATEHAVLVSMLKGDNTIWAYYMLKLMDLYRYHTGAAQPGLAVKTLNTVDVIVAERGLQNQFADFVHQVDKSKLYKYTCANI